MSLRLPPEHQILLVMAKNMFPQLYPKEKKKVTKRKGRAMMFSSQYGRKRIDASETKKGETTLLISPRYR